jgi:serine/threonine protein kinase/tetratricopeptide (TPR) repeat protein
MAKARTIDEAGEHGQKPNRLREGEERSAGAEESALDGSALHESAVDESVLREAIDVVAGAEAEAEAEGVDRGVSETVQVELETESDPDLNSSPPSIPSAASLEPSSAGDSAPASLEGRPAPVFPGELIADRYEMLSVLGEGGMGIVYRCRDQASGQIVAVKRVIVPPGALAEEYAMWFYKEARALAALEHPAIVRARDFGQLRDGSPYLAMDLINGVSLHDVTHLSLSFPLIWTVVDQILSALAHAHARGIVHGDLKPSNVLIEPRADAIPQVRILDFGLAWLRQDRHDERLDGAKAVVFAPHAGSGTPGYMAPEQIQHELYHVCGATDLYSLGCILYKLLSGRAPFSGDSKQLLRLHAFETAAEPLLAVSAPDSVTEFVMRSLAKKPWDRWEFAAEARAAWARWRPESVRPEEWRLPDLKNADRLERSSPTSVDTGPRMSNPLLAAVPERAPGLLSMRPSPLVGRSELRRTLRSVCREVIEGQGTPHRFLLLYGPAGVGKSRIAEWLCEEVHEEGSMVPLRVRYRPIRGPLEGMAGAALHYLNYEHVDRDTIESSLMDRWKVHPLDKSGRAWVAGAAEWLRPQGPLSERPLGPSGTRFTLDTLETRRMVARYTLRRLANRRPLLFWLDDLQHAGDATLEGLVRIHRDDPDQRIVMVATARSEDVQLGSAAAERLRELTEKVGGAAVEVPPLDFRTTCELLRESLPLEEDAVHEAARRSRGNPLFALQQLHAWALAGNMALSSGVYRVPKSVLSVRPQTTAELWDSRVAAMPESHRLAATAAATLGNDIRLEVLREALSSLGLPPDAAILSLRKAEVILPRGADRFGWPHALLQEHLLSRLDERSDRSIIYRAGATALASHPLARTRRIVLLRVFNLLRADQPNSAAGLLFDFLQASWSGAREPLATLADLDLLQGIQGRWLSLKHRWRAEALRHLGRNEEASKEAELARASFEELGDQENLAHCLRLLGHLSGERGNSVAGLRLVVKAYEIFSALGNVQGLAQCEAVGGEIEYLLGNYEDAREYIRRGEQHFAELNQPLGRGQCLLLHSWIEQSEGAIERARRLGSEARAEFERAGYQLGRAQADASMSHVEHRVMNYHSAEVGASQAMGAFQALRAPRGEAACHRLLAMIGIDTDDLEMAQRHADRASDLYQQMDDPWGVVETQLLRCQVTIVRRDLEEARALLNQCTAVLIEDAEPRQHYLLTRAWLEATLGDLELAFASLEAASRVFARPVRIADHTLHLLGRLSRFDWPAHSFHRIEAWRALLNDRARRREP